MRVTNAIREDLVNNIIRGSDYSITTPQSENHKLPEPAAILAIIEATEEYRQTTNRENLHLVRELKVEPALQSYYNYEPTEIILPTPIPVPKVWASIILNTDLYLQANDRRQLELKLTPSATRSSTADKISLLKRRDLRCLADALRPINSTRDLFAKFPSLECNNHLAELILADKERSREQRKQRKTAIVDTSRIAVNTSILATARLLAS